MAYVLDPNTADPETVARRYGAPEWGATASSRAVTTAELLKILPPKLEGQLKDLYEKIERPLARVLAQMERTGVKIDTAFLTKQSEAMNERLLVLEEQVPRDGRQSCPEPQLPRPGGRASL
jgi:DNA polymerase-1